ncbi:MAG TPA: phosphoribosyltransferase family protein [Herpetosiphonaceae bacterium]|nr:phosphoribosyltransferase family protein [Herpetosiphonaceae bacterium]
MRSYDYSRRSGIEPISWQRFEELVRALAEQVEPFEPQIILGIARGGLFPATMLSFVLRREFYPIRLTRRVDDAIVHEKPTWLVRPPDKVRGRRILVVDEIVDSGRTIALAADETRALGASEVRTAALYAHSWADPRPDYVALTSDALILNPWDREVLIQGRWATHPELAAALKLQRPAGPSPEAEAPPDRTH